MANKIQSIRAIYDVAKSAREAHNPLDDEIIKKLLRCAVNDAEFEDKYNRFKRGYAAEDLFMCIYSMLPWVKLITPLGQEQFPEISKEEYQVSDYEVLFECGSKLKTEQCLIEVKLVDGDKQTHEVKKYQYEVLRNYAEGKREKILFAIFWRKKMIWTVIPIDVFDEKSSCYKIDFDTANQNDLSAIFGDYTYVFNEKCFRKSKFEIDAKKSDYCHGHEVYGRAVYEGLSIDGEEYYEMSFFEPPVLDAAFDFKEISHDSDDNVTELREELDKIPYNYRLSSLIIAFLYKIYCYDKDNMYTENNIVVENAFSIVDTIRRKMGGKKYYLIPQKMNDTTLQLLKLQFSECNWIMSAYNTNRLASGYVILAPHDAP